MKTYSIDKNFKLSLDIIVKKIDIYKLNNLKAYKIVYIPNNINYSINNKNYILKKSSICCLDENDVLEIKKIDKIKAIIFQPQFINKQFNFKILKNEKISGLDLFWIFPFVKNHENYLSISLNIEEQDKVLNYINNIDRFLNKQDIKFWPCQSKTNLTELLSYIMSIEDMKKNHIPTIEKITDFININYKEQITIDLLCKKFGLNKNRLQAMFKDRYGLTINAYIIERRLQIASHLLSTTYLTITDIIEKSGFKSSSNFNKKFKEKYQNSPKEYRKKCQ